MRFVLLIVGATATGALSAFGIQAMFPQTKQAFQAVTALGGDLANFKTSANNPSKADRDVVQQAASGEAGKRISLPASPKVASTAVNPDNFKPAFKSDDKETRRAFAARIKIRVQQNMRRAQDVTADGRNPMRWHRAPPQ